MLGMLWEVTDCDIDLMTAHFMSLWIPSKAEHSWKAIVEKSWCQGTIGIIITQDYKIEVIIFFWSMIFYFDSLNQNLRFKLIHYIRIFFW